MDTLSKGLIVTIFATTKTDFQDHLAVLFMPLGLYQHHYPMLGKRTQVQ